MAGNVFGKIFRVTTFGESHGPAVGCVIDGCPAGVDLSAEIIAAELERRRPASTVSSTARREEDAPEILSGIFEGKTLGTPIAIVIRNTGQRSGDYDELAGVYRPGHADWTWEAKYGRRDHRGGGRSSGRETAARVAAGAAAKCFLAAYGVSVSARAVSIGGETEEAAIEALLEQRKAEGDSAGGLVECRIAGIPAGLGEPVFDKIGARIGAAVLSIGACKGVEFGGGFAAAASRGSANNDAPLLPPRSAEAGAQNASFADNHAGGMLGGISNGMEIVFRAAFKPAASISRPQDTIAANGGKRRLAIRGRHDLCIVPRVLPVVEAMAALVTADLLLEQRCAPAQEARKGPSFH
ncbi:MAG: chorismate synthase [Treponema sp.]|jgi:chorismate synthase|nr:chorismate synthase [Treponema sp.]